MTGQLDLWSDGWDVEPCDTAAPDEQAAEHLPARTGDPPTSHAVETRYGHGLDDADDQPRIIPGDHGQPPGRRRELEPQTIHNVVRSL